MLIFRYPLTNPDKYELTDEVDIRQLDKVVGVDNAVEINVTIDKLGSRQSMASIALSEEDLAAFHEKYLEHLHHQIETFAERVQYYQKKVWQHRRNWHILSELMEEMGLNVNNTFFPEEEEADRLEVVANYISGWASEMERRDSYNYEHDSTDLKVFFEKIGGEEEDWDWD